MKISKIKQNEFNCNCDKCKLNKKELNRVDFEEFVELYQPSVFIDLCDECLQELNRKIVDCLADKNI